jgi:hypothetical protein
MAETNFKNFTEEEFQQNFIDALRSKGKAPADIYGRQLADRELLNLTDPNKNATGGKGLDPFTQAVAGTVANRAIDYMINPKVSETTTTQSIPSQIPQMPQQYDTSPYRALDIIGAGIARRPTQEGYFNQLEKMQNARLEDAYNRRTDTDEAKNLQGLIQKTFPNLDKDIVSKISPDYFSKNYPLIAQIAERETSATAKINSDREAKDTILAFYPDIDPKQLNAVNASNYKDVMKKLESEKDFNKQKQLKLYEASLKTRTQGVPQEKEGKTDKKFKSEALEHLDSIAKLETAEKYIKELDRTLIGGLTPDFTDRTKALASSLDKLAAPQVKALAGPGAITEGERATFTPLVITSKDNSDLAMLKFKQSMSDAISTGIKKIYNAYSVGSINDSDYNALLTKYMTLAKKHGVKIQQ